MIFETKIVRLMYCSQAITQSDNRLADAQAGMPSPGRTAIQICACRGGLPPGEPNGEPTTSAEAESSWLFPTPLGRRLYTGQCPGRGSASRRYRLLVRAGEGNIAPVHALPGSDLEATSEKQGRCWELQSESQALGRPPGQVPANRFFCGSAAAISCHLLLMLDAGYGR